MHPIPFFCTPAKGLMQFINVFVDKEWTGSSHWQLLVWTASVIFKLKEPITNSIGQPHLQSGFKSSVWELEQWNGETMGESRFSYRIDPTLISDQHDGKDEASNKLEKMMGLHVSGVVCSYVNTRCNM